AAKSGYDFLTNHCFDSDGRMFFDVTRDGKPLRKRRYYFSECFAASACAEYARASGDHEAFLKSSEIYKQLLFLYRNPEKLTPKVNPETRIVKTHSQPMILMYTAQTLRDVDNSSEYNSFIDELIDTLFECFVKPEEKALFETVGVNGERLNSPQGRCINPGHSIETVWILLRESICKKDKSIMQKALNVLEWTLELGWDKEYGGLYSFVDIEGKPCEQLEWDMKLWWPHTEALYALLLAHMLSGDEKYETWYNRIHEWSFTNFGDPQYGDWFGYLHRDGTVANQLKGSLWKGPFHLPRALMFIRQLFKMMQDADKSHILHT
ncbi:MAG: AGE family epimerase/isomerase, partial [Eubacteriales bacterium]|nr:AGE family epimerase/isomerase [Eubacteriales bacterium]